MGFIVEYLCVKSGDPSCIVFAEKQTDTQTNGSELKTLPRDYRRRE